MKILLYIILTKFNLCTMYDLVDSSTDKKRRLLSGCVLQYASDGFDSVNLKL